MKYNESMIDNSNKPIILIGMHRSGTTMLSRLFINAGINMGQQLGPNFEDLIFQNANRRLLKIAGAHWAKPKPFLNAINNKQFIIDAKKITSEVFEIRKKSESLYWGWKDPRTTITLPIWLTFYPEAKIIHIIRNGMDVSMSLFRREIGRYTHRSLDSRLIPPTFQACYNLWQLYVKTGRSYSKIFDNYLEIHYEDILHNPKESNNLIREFSESSSFPELDIDMQLVHSPRPKPFWVQKIARLTWKLGIRDKSLMNELGYTFK
jgi:hypothetical protein